MAYAGQFHKLKLFNIEEEPIPVVRRKPIATCASAMAGKRGQGARRLHGGPCNDEQRSTRLSDALAATPDYGNRF